MGLGVWSEPGLHTSRFVCYIRFRVEGLGFRVGYIDEALSLAGVLVLAPGQEEGCWCCPRRSLLDKFADQCSAIRNLKPETLNLDPRT